MKNGLVRSLLIMTALLFMIACLPAAGGIADGRKDPFSVSKEGVNTMQKNGASSAVDKTAPHPVDPTQWTATDALGRTVSTNTETGDPREDKTLAMFCWTWHGDFANSQPPHNVQEYLNKYTDKDKAVEDLWNDTANDTRYHFWDEPVFGYYHGNDEWVIRKQCELLASAGVDVIFFDNTNGAITWMDTTKKYMKVFSEAMKDGVKAPKISLMLNFGPTDGTKEQLQKFYDEVYSKGLYKETWYYLDGKPMLMGYPEAAPNDEIRDFFTFRKNVPGYEVRQQEKGSGEWGWLSMFPQALYYDKDGNIEQTTVGVAVNANYATGDCPYPMNWPDAMGRRYTSKGIDQRSDALLRGACLSEQFENAIAADPKTIFVTGWNEWVAQKLRQWPGTSYTKAFVDEYNDEFSRDIEPSAGPLKDNYYYQFVDYVRKFKGAGRIETASQEKTIDLDGGFEQWADVGPAYNDYFGLGKRDSAGYKGVEYKNDTARNDIYDAKVARDRDNLYFMVRTVDDITPHTDPYWMRLFIDTGENNGWESFNYIVNRESPKSDKVAQLERFTGKGFETEKVCDVDYRVNGNVLVIRIPKKALGIAGDDFSFNFKWTDNTRDDGDIMLWYSNGDVAPIGRFKFCYTTAPFEEHKKTVTVAGYSKIDLKNEKDREETVYRVEGLKQKADGEGLRLEPDTAADAKVKPCLMLSWQHSSPRPVVTRFPYVCITYKAENGGEPLKAGIGATAEGVEKDRLKPEDIKSPDNASGSDGAGARKLSPDEVAANVVRKLDEKAAAEEEIKAIGLLKQDETVELVCDGKEHTLLLDISGYEKTKIGGYIKALGIYPENLKGALTISSIQLLTEEDAKNVK